MNPIQKYPHIIELSAFILNMFVLMFLCPINLLVSLGMCYTPKLSKQITSLFFKCNSIDTYKAIQCVPAPAYSSRFITYVPCFIILGKLSH